jgi:tRNA 2-thiouridine synthesizing protein A
MDSPLNLVLFSGTDDKLQAAAVLAAGAAALGKPVNVFLQYWALDSFRADRIDRDHGLAPEARAEGRAAVDALAAAGQATWASTLRQAKELGGVDIQACSLSMDLLGLEPADLDPLVDTTITQLVDARGLSCPMPIVRTAQAIKSLPSGYVIEVLATDPGSVKDFAAWCRSTGNELIESSSDGAVYRFVIRRK